MKTRLASSAVSSTSLRTVELDAFRFRNALLRGVNREGMLRARKFVFDPATMVRGNLLCRLNKTPLEVSGSYEWQSRGNILSDTEFAHHLKYVSNSRATKVSPGKIVGYRLLTPATVADICSEICGNDKSRYQGYDYECFFREFDMTFSLRQVKHILWKYKQWGQVLNLNGLANLFPVITHDRRRVYWVVARRVGTRWEISDSIIGRGRGFDTGANFIVKNQWPEGAKVTAKK